MASRGTKSPSPPERSSSSHGYRSSRLSPRRKSRSPLRQHSPSSRARRRSLSKGSRDVEHQGRFRERRSPLSHRVSRSSSSQRVQSSELNTCPTSGRHNPGATEPLPSEVEQKKIQISVRNPTADTNPAHNGTVNLQIEDVQITRRMGEGCKPLFEFLGNLSAPVRRVVLVNQTPEIKQEPLSHSCRTQLPRDRNVLERRDAQVSPSIHRGHSSTSDRHLQSRPVEPGHSRSEWDRDRDHESDKVNERNGDYRRGDFQDRARRRDDRERESPRSRTRDRERNRELGREKYVDKERERGETKDFDSTREKGQSKDSDKERGRDKAETNRSSGHAEQSEPSNEIAGPAHIRPPVPYMNRGMMRPRGPMYPPPMMGPPFMPRGPVPPYMQRGLPPHMFGHPPPFLPPRMMGPRPRF